MWEFRPEINQQVRHRTTGEVRMLQQSESRLLRLLLMHPHRAVTKEEIHNFVWPGKVVSDNSITQTVSSLRTVLGDSGAAQNVIRTVPKVGYFINPNRVALIDEAPSVADSKPTACRGRVWACLALLLVNVLLFGFLFVPQDNAARLTLSRFVSGNNQFFVESDDVFSLELMKKLRERKQPNYVDFYITSNQARVYVSCVDRAPEAERRNSINFSIDIEQSLEYVSHEILQQCQ
ncbi:winged helix-turn-helix domain-containing protein [Photobacterium chitinilyticum]|uniref:winged helix-turn-helix domain-containing protein n=1 Tax=Photobacterium chitinilyticum TaxID=2485123 RepID=UPI003D0BE2A0